MTSPTRTESGNTTASPGSKRPVCLRPMSFCHFFNAAAVASVNFSSTVNPP
ncbi:hypothetical protein EHYA_09719 [Embleya hyalina]|uniref:Uncharacterized protein n=1 Tax=Embleya hyalina TaxID=516124 RepID=A0A401Z518_9ACTN|nr:hypothetical protein EHYA_09719 [Embleya hyalina]